MQSLLVKFSLLWEILPYYGHFPLWKYMMLNACIETKKVWIKNEKAFKELSKNMKMSVIKYNYKFDKDFK